MAKFEDVFALNNRKEKESFESYWFFPPKDRIKVVAVVNDNIKKIEEGIDPYKDLLFPSAQPDLIQQGSYAISETVPLELTGVGPCIGVILFNKEVKRAMAVHLEARDEEEKSILEAEARKFCELIKKLFETSADRIAVVSSLLGLYPYHDAIKKELGRRFDMKADEIEEYTPFVAGVKIDPQACAITEKSI